MAALLGSSRGWNAVGPNEKMPKYDALRDPHLRIHHTAEPVRRHMRKMNKIETQEAVRPDAEAKLAWRMVIHQMYATPQRARRHNPSKPKDTRPKQEGDEPKGKRGSRKAAGSARVSKAEATSPAEDAPSEHDSRSESRSSRSGSRSSRSSGSRDSYSPRSKGSGSRSRSRSGSRSHDSDSPRSDGSRERSRESSDASSPQAKEDEGKEKAEEEEKEKGEKEEIRSGTTDEGYEDDFDYTEKSPAIGSPEKADAPADAAALPDAEVKAWIEEIRKVAEMDKEFKMLSKPCKVVADIYLGGEKAALNVTALKDLGVVRVINCAPSQCKKVGPQLFEDTGIVYSEIDADDAEDYPLLDKHHAQVLSTLESADGAGTLIHCFQGVNRSASLVVASLMVRDRMHLIEAVRTAHTARPIILQGNDGFLRQLILLAHKEGLLSPP